MNKVGAYLIYVLYMLVHYTSRLLGLCIVFGPGAFSVYAFVTGRPALGLAVGLPYVAGWVYFAWWVRKRVAERKNAAQVTI